MNALAYYQARVPGLMRDGGDFRARCPLHQGTTDNSLAIDGKTFKWFCHGACGRGGDPIELEMGLFGLPFPEAKKAVESIMGTDHTEALVPFERPIKKKPFGRIVATYDYRDAAGALVYQVVRCEPKDFRQRRPDDTAPGGWTWSIKGLETLLYRLPEVLASEGVVYIAEGEKDVDALRGLGLVATCNSGGAGKFTASMARHLAGRPVVILPDADAAGAKHADDVGTLLRLEGCRVKRVELPGVKDPADWVAAGGTVEQLWEIQAATEEWGGVLAVRHAQAVEPQPAGMPENIHEMLQNYVILVGTTSIFDKRTHRQVKPEAVKLAHGSQAFKGWSEHEDRLRVDADKLVFKPEGAEPDEMNLFGGLPELRPTTGDTSAWFEHVKVLCGGDQALADWVVARLAFKLQNLGAKVATSIVFHGAQGTGKNLLFDPLLSIYGRYGAEVGQQQIDSPYTDWLSGKLLLVADEVAGQDARATTKNRLKGLITSPRLAINEKFASVRHERNAADLHFLSNDDVPVIVEASDRRFCVVRCDDVRASSYYVRLAQVDPAALKAALLAWDVQGFHAHTKPPETAAKQELAKASASSAERFLAEWLAGELPVPVTTAASADLYRAYDTWCKTRGERLRAMGHTAFGREAGRHLSSARTNARRYWHPINQAINEEGSATFGNALSNWIKGEQALRL